LWNEPANVDYWCGNFSQIVILAEHAYTIIKKLQPSAIIISPSNNNLWAYDWFDSFFAAGGIKYIDVIGFHAYPYSNPLTIEGDLTNYVNLYRNNMQQWNLTNLPIICTEASFGTAALASDADRAGDTAKYFILLWSLGVEKFVWYAYDWGGDSAFYNITSASLRTPGVAFKNVQNWMVNATMSQNCTQPAGLNNTWTCDFTRPGGYHAQAIWNSVYNLVLPVSSTYTQYRDLWGGTHPITSPYMVPVTTAVILLEGWDAVTTTATTTAKAITTTTTGTKATTTTAQAITTTSTSTGTKVTTTTATVGATTTASATIATSSSSSTIATTTGTEQTTTGSGITTSKVSTATKNTHHWLFLVVVFVLALRM